MTDHHEPAVAVAIPSPSSAFVPRLQSEQSSQPKNASLGKENVKNDFVQNIPDVVKITAPSPLHVEIHPGKNESCKLGESEKNTVQVTADTVSQSKPVFSTSTHTSIDTSGFDNKKLTNQNSLSNHTPGNLSAESSSCTTISSSATSQATKKTVSATSVSSIGVIQTVITHPVDSLLPHVLTQSLPTSATNLISCVSSASTPFSGTPSTGFKTGMVPRNILKPAIAPNLQKPSSSCADQQSKPPIVLPEVIPEFQTGKIDAKRFPARHFDLRTLNIGSWKYEARSGGFFASKTSRLKVIFSQKKFIYEFELRDTCNPGIMAFYQKEKQMASIEVPFSSVVGLNISKENPHQLLIEVNLPPLTYLGKQELHSSATGCALPTKYDTTNPVDLTNGEILVVPYHQVSLCSTNLRGRLEEFDPRFRAMLRTPIIMDPNKRLQQQPPVKPVKHKNINAQDAPTAAKRSRKTSSASSSSGTEGICSCTSGCNSQRCKCVKTNGKCSNECKCVACKNPLNILANNGVDIALAKEDKCLMQNIFRISDLEKLLKEKKERTPCCDVLMPFKDICVGIFDCPECESEYQFSWCSFSLCDDECRPRNHCAICRRCGDYRDDHCFKCNKCYFAGSAGSFKCPCEERLSFIDSLSLFLNNFVDPEDSSDNDYY